MKCKLNARFLPLLAMAIIVIACGNARSYQGDGKLIDNGPSAATDRYILDLGPLILSKKSSAQYNITELPREKFVPGIELTNVSGGDFDVDKAAISATVSITIVDEQGKELVQVAGPLSAWIWSVSRGSNAAFVYGGYGPKAFFEPKSNDRYIVQISVTDPSVSTQNISARVLLKSGGWK